MIRSNSLARAGILAGLVSGCVLLSAPAFAADGDLRPQAAMSVQGIDFTSPRSVAHLKRHLQHVALDMCVTNSGRTLLMSPDERACYAAAINDGLTQIDIRAQQAMRERTVRLADARADGHPAH